MSTDNALDSSGADFYVWTAIRVLQELSDRPETSPDEARTEIQVAMDNLISAKQRVSRA